MHSALWWRDFEFENGVVTVKKTGARLPIEPGLIGEVLSWFPFYFVVESWRMKPAAKSGPKFWFAPDRPRPWYLIWSVLHAAGASIANSAEEADIIFFFDDATTSKGVELPRGARTVNLHCQSIAKSHVADVFEDCFGYSLSVDPASWTGPMVEKSELNAAHDGRIIHGPCEPREGRVYQRVIDNSIPNGLVEDIRCPTIGGEIPIVMLKRRKLSERFLNSNTECVLAETDKILSRAEQQQLAKFTKAMQLDWGSLDVLRDKRDNRLYVVDVNKTDMGPPVAMALNDKIKATKRLAASLLNFLSRSTDYDH